MRVIISGGGTGGHIFPAISIAGAIKAKDPDAEILFVGASGRMEMTRVPAAGYKITGIPARGLKRPLYSLSNIGVAFDYFRCKAKARKIIKEFKPDLVVGVGGYASAAIVGAASSMKIPVLLQEQNSFAGLVNRKNGKNASLICVAYQGMERFFPKEKIILTGNPVRSDIIAPNESMRQEACKEFGLSPKKKTVFFVGGSLGCRTLNEFVKKMIAKGHPLYQIIWQCGSYYKDECSRFMASSRDNSLYWSDFIKSMNLAYAMADVVVSRAGAGTISELCIAGKCTIFVPSPVVAEDHQTHNAMALVKANAAMIVKDSDAMMELAYKIDSLISNDERIKELSSNISALAKRDAASVIAEKCFELVRQRENRK